VHYTTSCNTQSSAPEDGRNNSLKHVELIGIINKPLLLHLVGCVYMLMMHGQANIKLMATLCNTKNLELVQPYELMFVELDCWNIKISSKNINVACMNIHLFEECMHFYVFLV